MSQVFLLKDEVEQQAELLVEFYIDQIELLDEPYFSDSQRNPNFGLLFIVKEEEMPEISHVAYKKAKEIVAGLFGEDVEGRKLRGYTHG